ncbi:unnamed protein product [Chrysoparadoxa australica]
MPPPRNPPPEATIVKRKCISKEKAAKRLKKFLEQEETKPDDEAELVSAVPADTLIQLQQIHAALTGGKAKAPQITREKGSSSSS